VGGANGMHGTGEKRSGFC